MQGIGTKRCGAAADLLATVFFCCAAACGEELTDIEVRCLQRIQELTTHEEVCWRRGAPVADGKAGQPVPNALPVAVDAAQSADVAARLRGLEGLAAEGPERHAEDFLKALADADPEIRAFARDALASPAVRGEVFRYAVDALADRTAAAGTVDAILPELRPLLEEGMLRTLESVGETPERKLAAAYALGRMKSAQGVPALVRAAWGTDASLAATAIQALIQVSDPVTIPYLAALGGHANEDLRDMAVRGLAGIDLPEASAALAQAVAGPLAPYPDLAQGAVKALGHMKNERVTLSLIEAMEGNEAVRRTAAASLAESTGQELGSDPAAWRNWYSRGQGGAVAPAVPVITDAPVLNPPENSDRQTPASSGEPEQNTPAN